MAVDPRRRKLILGIALAVTLGLVAWVGQQESPDGEDADARPAPRAARGGTPARQAAPGGEELSLARGEMPPASGRDPFAPQTWNPPPDAVPPPAAGPAAAPPPPSPPQVPDFPFAYLGRLAEGSEITVYLAMPERNLLVRRGDVIDTAWRLEAIHPNRLVFRYLPLGRKKTLITGREQ